MVPRDRRRVYDVHRAIELLADDDSLLELRPSFAPGMVTALARLEGRPSASWPTTRCIRPAPSTAPRRQGGPVPPAVRRLRSPRGLAGRHTRVHGGTRGGGDGAGAPREPHVRRRLVAHRAALHRHSAQGLRVRCAGHGRGSFHRPLFTVAWPTGELGGMGLEGAVRLGFRRELDAIEDPDERDAASRPWSSAPTSTARHSTWRPLRNRRRDRSGADPEPHRAHAGLGRRRRTGLGLAFGCGGVGEAPVRRHLVSRLPDQVSRPTSRRKDWVCTTRPVRTFGSPAHRMQAVSVMSSMLSVSLWARSRVPLPVWPPGSWGRPR